MLPLMLEAKAIGLDPNGHNVQALQDVKDVGGGKLIASVKDADGNIIGLIQLAGSGPR